MNHVLFSNILIVMNRRTSQRQPGKLTLFSLLAVISGGFLALSAPRCQRRHKNGLVEALRNLRQVKFALDGFATDFDGQFPNAATGPILRKPATRVRGTPPFSPIHLLRAPPNGRLIRV